MNTIKIDFYSKDDLLIFRDKLQEDDVNYSYDEEEEDDTIEIYDIISFSKVLNRNNFYIEMVNKDRNVVFYDLEDKDVYSISIC